MEEFLERMREEAAARGPGWMAEQMAVWGAERSGDSGEERPARARRPPARLSPSTSPRRGNGRGELSAGASERRAMDPPAKKSRAKSVPAAGRDGRRSMERGGQNKMAAARGAAKMAAGAADGRREGARKRRCGQDDVTGSRGSEVGREREESMRESITTRAAVSDAGAARGTGAAATNVAVGRGVSPRPTRAWAAGGEESGGWLGGAADPRDRQEWRRELFSTPQEVQDGREAGGGGERWAPTARPAAAGSVRTAGAELRDSSAPRMDQMALWPGGLVAGGYRAAAGAPQVVGNGCSSRAGAAAIGAPLGFDNACFQGVSSVFFPLQEQGGTDGAILDVVRRASGVATPGSGCAPGALPGTADGSVQRTSTGEPGFTPAPHGGGLQHPVSDGAKASLSYLDGPLGGHLKQEVKEKIWRRENLDIFTLLPLERFSTEKWEKGKENGRRKMKKGGDID
ncbi:hypothetical protein GDO81_013950 [Engystomops pustulosus]|uniref:Uncharacterized protein n=1 Tax=Engystomops pustulosus TaxID=76066 RepID=A0AAV7B6V5_ENGPU|nr:hypothetical protein GDO81_013950 [Engystomops pustulosus]